MTQEPRKIVLILGNGFDLDLGRRTSYEEFWKSDYCPKNYPAPLISYLNSKWQDELEKVRWCDLENELMVYYRDYVSKGKVEDVLTNDEIDFLKMVKPDQMRTYLYENNIEQMQSLADKGYLKASDGLLIYNVSIPYLEDMLQSPETRDKIAFGLINQTLNTFIRDYGRPDGDWNSMANRVKMTIENAAENNDFVDVFSFNYTRVLVNNCKVYYVHGKCEDNNIIIGAGDSTQINRTYDFLYKSFDPNYYPPDITSSLNNADEVIFFGHSIGDNDRQYFKQFFKQQASYTQNSRKRITIFTRDRDSEIEIKRALQNMTDNNLSTLSSQNTIEYFHTSDPNYNYEKLKAFFVRFHLTENSAEDVLDCIYKRLRGLSLS